MKNNACILWSFAVIIPICVVLSMASCTKSNPVAPTIDVTGTWYGTYSTSRVPSASITFHLTQSEANLTGTYSASTGASGTITGTVSGNNIGNFSLNQTLPSCTGSFTGTATGTGDTMDFTFSGSDCLGSHTNGQGRVKRYNLGPPPSGLTVTPSSITVQAGQNAQAQISGGTLPYEIQNSPNSSIATASIYSIQGTSTLVVIGIGAGLTSVTVQDNSSPVQTVAVPVTVTGGGENLTGTWSGTFTTSIITTPSQIALVLSQSGSSVTGTYSTQGGGVGTVSGTVSGNTFTYALQQTTAGCPGSFTGSGTVSGNTMSFTFSGNDCRGTHSNGQGTVTKSTSTLVVRKGVQI